MSAPVAMQPQALDPSQERAVDLILTARVAVVTGGPGTGKTTTLRTALDRIDALGGAICGTCRGTCFVASAGEWGIDELERCTACAGTGKVSGYVLCAPTGKAARRMSEATGRAATTVHRALDYGPIGNGAFGFRRNALTPIDAALVVVDEASMLDAELGAALLAAISPTSTRLVLVGDADQLPSVGAGRVFGDVIDSGKVPVARLTTLHRAAAESWVCSQAPVILAGSVPALEPRRDFRFVAAEGAVDALEAIVRTTTYTLPRELGIAQDDVQVLIPQRNGNAGTIVANTRLQAILNPARGAAGRKVGEYELRAGDRVIQGSNDYFLGVMNGEVGMVEAVRDKAIACPTCEGRKRVYASEDDSRGLPCPACTGSGKLDSGVYVRFPDGGAATRLVRYEGDKVQGLSLAYALTVHKSQGSEWPWVVVCVHSTHTKMLTRRLIYTAVTRAKQGVVIVGDKKGIAAAVKEVSDARRNTRLAGRMRAA